MSFRSELSGLDEATFDAFGEGAQWSGLPDPVRVRISEPDEDQAVGRSRFVVKAVTLRVRVSDVPAPKKGDTVIVGAVTYSIVADPKANRRRTQWICEASEVSP